MEAQLRCQRIEVRRMKVWTLIWLLVTPLEDGGYSAKLYESNVYFNTPEVCREAQAALDDKLIAEGHTIFTTSCEEREL